MNNYKSRRADIRRVMDNKSKEFDSLKRKLEECETFEERKEVINKMVSLAYLMAQLDTQIKKDTIKELEEQRTNMIKKIRKIFGRNMGL